MLRSQCAIKGKRFGQESSCQRSLGGDCCSRWIVWIRSWGIYTVGWAEQKSHQVRSSLSQDADNQVNWKVYQWTVLMAWEESPKQTGWHTNNTCYCVWPDRPVGGLCLWRQVESAHSKPSLLLCFTFISLSSLSPISCGIGLRSHHLENWHSLQRWNSRDSFKVSCWHG